jgi:hypothetical protein
MRVMRDGCRLSVLSAITSTQQRLKLYNKVPNNVLVLYCGTVLTEDVKERQVGSAGSPVFACLSFLFTNSPPKEVGRFSPRKPLPGLLPLPGREGFGRSKEVGRFSPRNSPPREGEMCNSPPREEKKRSGRLALPPCSFA